MGFEAKHFTLAGKIQRLNWKSNGYPVLTPVDTRVSFCAIPIRLCYSMAELETYGFELTRLSGRTVAIKPAPADLPAGEARNMLAENSRYRSQLCTCLVERSCNSDGFFVFLQILLDRNEEAGFEVLRFKLLGRDRLPSPGNQNLRIDKGIERLLQAVNFDLPSDGYHFFNYVYQRISR